MDSSCLDNLEPFAAHIRSRLADNESLPISELQAGFRRAAVLMPLLKVDGLWHILFTRRSDHLQDHKGQVSFPGGAAEALDENPVRTACRELEEEVGIPQNRVEVLGRMPDMPTITYFLVTPVVGVLAWPVAWQPNPTEVERVFTIPLCWLADASNWQERLYRLPDGLEHPVIFYKEYQGELLWGITARIVQIFLQRVGLAG